RGADRRARAPSRRAAYLPEVRRHVPPELRAAEASGDLRQVRRRALPARRRPGGDRDGAARGLPQGDRAAAAVLPRAPGATAGRRHRFDRPGEPPDHDDPRDHRMIVLRSRQEIELIRAACQIVADVLRRLTEVVAPGVSTAELDRLTEQCTREKGAVPAFKGYNVGGRVYPSSLCVSI